VPERRTQKTINTKEPMSTNKEGISYLLDVPAQSTTLKTVIKKIDILESIVNNIKIIVLDHKYQKLKFSKN
jgi:hypothetical protein